MKKSLVGFAAALTAGLLTVTLMPHAAQASVASRQKVDAETTQEVQRALKKLGFASTVVDGRSSAEFKNILCSWREIVGDPTTRKQLSRGEAERILAMTELPVPLKKMVTGLNVNKECQSLALVVKTGKKTREYRKIFRVSTGAGGYDTSPGYHTITRRIDGLHNSSAYPSPSGWNMYRPAYFTGWGEAFHGSPSDASVSWAPSSHGCVRMLQRNVDYLWRTGGNAVGTQVYVYGTWQG